MKLNELHPLLAAWSLILFVAAFALHVVALFKLLPIPESLVAVLLLPACAAHFVLIMGVNGGQLFPKQMPNESGRFRKYFFAVLRFIPVSWRYPGLIFWYVYTPVVAVICITQENIAACFGLGIAAFALIHFLGFRFVLPQRDLIVEAANKT